MQRMRTLAIAALAAAIATLALAGPASAATIDVDTTADELNGDGDCALREAVRAANTNLPVDGCAAGQASADTIDVPAGTYRLAIPGPGEDFATAGDLDLTGGPSGPVRVAGAGARTTTVNGADLDRVFDLPSVGATARISGLTITNGTAPPLEIGGGVRLILGALTLRRVAITDNTRSAGPFSSGVGGGVASELGNLKVFDSVISRNRVPRPSGPISDTSGGGVAQTGGTAEITNTTVSANTAAGPRGSGGGIFQIAVAGPTTVKLTNTTVNGNGAATGANLESIGSAGTATITTRNSIVANPTGGGANCATAFGATITSSGGNLEFPGSSCGFTAARDKQNQNPLLAALANNGGQTNTHALRAASPAIDAARDSGCPATDQRGVARPRDGDGNGSARCDMGAFELKRRRSRPGGGGGDCTISRGGGNDIIRGTSGNDVICAGRGNDIVHGGGGNDEIRGGRGNDEIRGADGNDVLRGDEGNDRIEGGSGNDQLKGGDGNDRLIGGAGADGLSGQDGSDDLDAGDGISGNDVANGGAGSDTCSTDPGDSRTSC